MNQGWSRNIWAGQEKDSPREGIHLMTTVVANSERRASNRSVLVGDVPVKISFFSDGRFKELKANRVDLGEMGLGAELQDGIPVGVPVTVTMEKNGAPISAKGTVRWGHPIGKYDSATIELYKVGIQLNPQLNQPMMDVGGSINQDRRAAPDRRQPGPWFNRRNTNRRAKEFVLDHNVYLSDTNLVGNTYFAKHFEWQGHVREAFLFHVVNFPEFAKLGVKLITKEASCEYMSESTLGDPVALTLKVGKVTYARLELLFTFIHKITGKVISCGRQLIVFGGPKGKPIGIPDMILKGISPYR